MAEDGCNAGERCVQARCVVPQAMPVPLPFPGIFHRTVLRYGDLVEPEQHGLSQPGSHTGTQVYVGPSKGNLNALCQLCVVLVSIASAAEHHDCGVDTDMIVMTSLSASEQCYSRDAGGLGAAEQDVCHWYQLHTASCHMLQRSAF